MSGSPFMRGELTDTAKIEAALKEQNAVISLLGPSGRISDDALTQGVRSIVAAMQVLRVHRLVAISTSSASDPQDRVSLSFWLAIHIYQAAAEKGLRLYRAIG
jgi:nucleoside-diphosphate-sugar epimerase